MSDSDSSHAPAGRRIDVDAALRAVVEGTAAETGQRFFEALVSHLSAVLHTSAGWVTEWLPDERRLRALAFLANGRWIPDFVYDIHNTPCQPVIERACMIHHPDGLPNLYPLDDDVRAMGLVSYLGAPLRAEDGTVIGNVGVMDTRPIVDEPRLMEVFKLFATRATAEMQRLRAEQRLREREAQLDGVVNGALDCIVQLDDELRIRMVNPAAEKTFNCPAGRLFGYKLSRILTPDATAAIEQLAAGLTERPAGRQSLFLPEGLHATGFEGPPFPVEGTLARCHVQGRPCFTLILRSIQDRIDSERRINALRSEAETLREELRALGGVAGGDLVGQSPPVLQMLRDIKQVADTDATVLVLGETGTGKELVARAIHNASRRKDRPLVKVNCAALPANLVESEFFGHEKGAFTGATARREGRFALADGGTIFLDEIGELPLDLQSKLLRVLQEGEFEPVGSSQTRKIDVRVIAATNRDLKSAADAGTFRKDLYFRLNVFPIHVPALRDRGDDVLLLAHEFAQRFARTMGRRIAPLSPAAQHRLKAYAWPGNIRELENVIERAVITARDGHLNLDRALPEPAPAPAAPAVGPSPQPAILTAAQLLDVERDNIRRALDACAWRVAGETGAAKLLGLPASTLASRIKALKIQKPDRAPTP